MIPRAVFEQTLYGFLQPVRQYLDDPSVTEILINGPSQVYVERRGRLERVPVSFDSREAVLTALRNAAQFVGKHIDERHPILEARLPDGSRLQAAIAPVAPDGPYVAIRRFSAEVFELETLVERGSLSQPAAELLRAVVRAKQNVIVAGGTGSGKTSMLNALTRFVPEYERIAVIEDSKEVQVQRPHVVYLEARPPDLDGAGAVSIRELFRTSLRLRPDRIVIGEIRGGEALDIIQAMVSGHGGCMGTLHATYPRDTLTRLETMALMSDVELPLAALRLQIASGVNVIVQMSRSADGSRKVTHVSEVAGFDLSTNRYELVDLFRREYGSAGSGSGLGELLPTGATPTFQDQLQEHALEFSHTPAVTSAVVS
jgi:pilus assembly protein CpaF